MKLDQVVAFTLLVLAGAPVMAEDLAPAQVAERCENNRARLAELTRQSEAIPLMTPFEVKRIADDVIALGSIAAAHRGQHLIVVTHGGVLDMVWRTARGLSLSGPRRSEIPNAGFNRIRIADPSRPDDIEIVEWADARHLADLPPQPTYDQTRHLKNKD